MNYKAIICDVNNLYDAYLKSIKGSKWKESSQRVMCHYLEHLSKLQNELQQMTYQPSEEGEFILHERGKIRPITSLQPRDRIVRHVLCDCVLMPAIQNKLIYDNGASIKGKGISFSRKRFEAHLRKYYMHNKTNDGYILFGDFRKFYDNIPHEQIKAEFLKLLDNDDYIAWLLDTIFNNFKVDVSYMSNDEYATCMDSVFDALKYRDIPKSQLTGEKFMYKSVNIGDQISQLIGIYYPYAIDNYIKTVCGQKYYGRYMDDWYIISPSVQELKKLLQDIEAIATKYGIHINHKKTRIVKLSSTYKYLQIRYTLTDTGKVIKRINPKRVTAMRKKLKKLAMFVEQGKIDYQSAENVFRSWMGANYKIMSKATRQNLVCLFEKLFNTSITINSKNRMIFHKNN